ncbi:hypothetical protein BHE74_00029307 [Ensete ventricosum]|uniref:Uncharacterized protein n=1 Tax=Ensete ventricosum TaxID=4639 RepID=A0A444DRV1_ENSVE|nr:hypothetical protein GW17_00036151 [Ensete ventricosum]RWW63507.1 hypothetical protein BHE74_00029307 [Ensete ventricosum]RZR71501.1 hypothetical protein BHM03_00005514 [Ensete ventricosum]
MSPRSFSPPGETFRLLGRESPVGGDGAVKGGILLSSSSPLLLLSSFPLLLLVLFFSLNRPLTAEIHCRWSISPSINRRRPKSTTDDRFWRYHLVAGGPHTDNLADRYVPPVLGGTNRNCIP